MTVKLTNGKRLRRKVIAADEFGRPGEITVEISEAGIALSSGSRRLPVRGYLDWRTIAKAALQDGPPPAKRFTSAFLRDPIRYLLERYWGSPKPSTYPHSQEPTNPQPA